jgi:hypothetical protein
VRLVSGCVSELSPVASFGVGGVEQLCSATTILV